MKKQRFLICLTCLLLSYSNAQDSSDSDLPELRPDPRTDIQLKLTNLKTASKKRYGVFNISAGEKMYIDRKHTFTSPIPPTIDGELTIRPANNDKFSDTTNVKFISFDVNRDVNVYILYTHVNTTLEADWLNDSNDWISASYTIPTSLNSDEANRLVRMKSFPAGTIELPGNGSISQISSMYHVVVTPSSAVNTTPIARNDSATIVGNITANINVLANDEDDDRDPLTIINVTPAPNGKTAVTQNNMVSYTPNASFSGTDRFSYTISDSNGGVDSATVSVTVRQEEEKIGITSLTVGSGRTYELFPIKGGESMYIDRNFVFTSPIPAAIDNQLAIRPANDDKFSSTSDANFISFDVDRNVTIYLLYSGVNTSLEADWLNDTNGWESADFTVPTSLTGVERNRRVRMKDFSVGRIGLPGNGGNDVFSSMYHIVVVEQKSTEKLITDPIVASEKNYELFSLERGEEMYIDRNYTFSSSIPRAIGGQLTIRPANNDKFSSTSDSDFISFDATRDVNVHVVYTNVNTALEADWLNESNGWKQADFMVSTTLNGDEAKRLVRTKNFPAGTINLPGNGSTRHTSSMYHVVVAPNSVTNTVPKAYNDSITITNNISADIDVLANDRDDDGNPLVITRVTPANNGKTSINTNGTVNYTPRINFSGTDRFTYTVSDGDGKTDSATVEITVISGDSEEITITNLILDSGYQAEVARLQNGERTYIGRDDIFVSPVPEILDGQLLIRLADDDKFSSTADSDFLSFEVDQEVDIFILYTNINTTLEADWLNDANGWISPISTVLTTLPGHEADRLIRKKTFSAGTIKLPGNGSLSNNSSMYHVVVRQPIVTSGFHDELLFNGLNQPTALAFLPDQRLLILHKDGLILIADPDDQLITLSTYMNIETTDSIRERGLMDITLDPNFESNSFFYLYYRHEPSSRFRISRFKHMGGSGDRASEVVIWETEKNNTEAHHGGGLDFGPGGKLYLTTGDGSTPARAQDLSDLAGKIIRINRDGSIPSDNPFFDGPGGNADAVWAYGLRNPFRARWDMMTERFFIGEVGGNRQNIAWEDVHLGQAGANYGWPLCEGPCDSRDFPSCNCTEHDDPIFAYPHSGYGASVTGGVVYRGDQFPDRFVGAYFYGDFVRQWIRYLTFNESGNFVTGDFDFKIAAGNVVAIEEGPDGSLYYADIFGKVHRIVYFDE